MRKAAALALVALAVLLGADVVAAPRECRRIHFRSMGGIECKYNSESELWTLRYSRGAYLIVSRRGQHDNLLDSLCDVRGKGVYEKHDGEEEYHECK